MKKEDTNFFPLLGKGNLAKAREEIDLKEQSNTCTFHNVFRSTFNWLYQNRSYCNCSVVEWNGMSYPMCAKKVPMPAARYMADEQFLP
jgi:hypothetical protein